MAGDHRPPVSSVCHAVPCGFDPIFFITRGLRWLADQAPAANGDKEYAEGQNDGA